MTKGQCCECSISTANLSFDGLAESHHEPQTLDPLCMSMHVSSLPFSLSLHTVHKHAQLMTTAILHSIYRHPVLVPRFRGQFITPNYFWFEAAVEYKLSPMIFPLVPGRANSSMQATCTTPRRNSFSTFEASPPQSGSPQAITAPVVVRDANAL